jgi:galactose oxidase-like protein/Kelch motif protein
MNFVYTKKPIKHISLLILLNILLISEIQLVSQNNSTLATPEIDAENYQNAKASDGSYFPSARDFPAIVIDPQTDLIYLFGGQMQGTGQSDLWSYNQTSDAWNYISTTTPVGALFGHSFCFDGDRNRMVIFGGYGGSGGDICNELWFYYPANNSWYNPNPPSSPRPHSGIHGNMCYNGYLKAYIVAGGGDANLLTYNPGSYAYFTENNSWQEMSYIPGSRGYPMMVYDTSEQQVMLFGGDISEGLFGGNHPEDQMNTLFYLNNGNKAWNIVSATDLPVAMPYFMVYDSISKKPTIYNTDIQTYTSKFYTLTTSTSTWTEVNPLNKPTSTLPMGLVYCESENHFLFFGGVNNGTNNLVNI